MTIMKRSRHLLLIFILLLVSGFTVTALGQGITPPFLKSGSLYGLDAMPSSDSLAISPRSSKKAVTKALLNTVLPTAAAFTLLSQVNIFDDSDSFLLITGGLLGFYGLIIGPSTGNLYANDLPRGLGGIAFRGLMVFGTRDGNNDMLSRLLFVGSIVYNIASAPASVNMYNRKNHLSVTPTLDLKTASPLLAIKYNF